MHGLVLENTVSLDLDMDTVSLLSPLLTPLNYTQYLYMYRQCMGLSWRTVSLDLDMDTVSLLPPPPPSYSFELHSVPVYV